MARQVCFVLQSFGEKVDLPTGRVLNLDASYRVVKEAVEESGLRCLRADELVSPGHVDSLIYKWLLVADLVIADLSTSSVIAAHELGVRYALRPRATIIIAEDQFHSFFDVGHVMMLSYKHLGAGIEVTEAQRFKTALKARIQVALAATSPDSPVYAYLPLNPPTPLDPVEPVVPDEPPAAPTSGAVLPEERSAKSLLDNGRIALNQTSFWAAKMFLRALRALRPSDESVVLELAAATYKARLPDPETALEEACGLLESLNPRLSNNPETLKLWGTVHVRLWELTGDQSHLSESVTALDRAFHTTQSYEVANELAYALDLRADANARASDRWEAIADFVLARRIRRASMKLCEDAIKLDMPSVVHKYWRLAALWEAAAGLEDAASVQTWRQQAEAATPAPWRVQVTLERIGRIQRLIAAYPLRNPATSVVSTQ
jgi:hypothetical protein